MPHDYEVVQVSGVTIGVGIRKQDGLMLCFDMMCNTLMEGDRTGDRARKRAEMICDALNELEELNGVKAERDRYYRAILSIDESLTRGHVAQAKFAVEGILDKDNQ